MRNLLYKEFNLTIHVFWYTLLPLMISLLFFIPGWIFTLVFMYYFWVTVPNVLGGYQSQLDYQFNQLLPVTKREIVIAKTTSHYVMQLVQIVFGVLFGWIHILLYGEFNFFIEIGPALFGVVFMMYGLFNIIMFPLYFKTAWRWGKPLIYAVIATVLFAGFLEYGVTSISFITETFNYSSLATQLWILGVGIVGGAGLSVIATMRSIHNFEAIK